MDKFLNELIEKYKNLSTVFSQDVVDDLMIIKKLSIYEPIENPYQKEEERGIEELRAEYLNNNPEWKKVPPRFRNDPEWILAKIKTFSS